MKKHRKTLLAFTLVIACFSFTIIDWVEFKSHSFLASFPKTPEADSQLINSPIGKLRFNSFMYDASGDSTDENLVYGVMTTAYPKELGKQVQDTPFIRGIFDGAVKGAVNSVKGKMISQKDVSFQGYPGREVKIDFQNGLAIIRMRMYMVKAMMYTLQTITFTGKDENKSIYRFINSFKLEQ